MCSDPGDLFINSPNISHEFNHQIGIWVLLGAPQVGPLEHSGNYGKQIGICYILKYWNILEYPFMGVPANCLIAEDLAEKNPFTSMPLGRADGIGATVP